MTISSSRSNYRVFSLTWPACMQIYCNKRSVCIRKKFNSQKTGFGHQHGCCFIVWGHQYGRRDVMWKHSIALMLSTKRRSLWISVFSITSHSADFGRLRKTSDFFGDLRKWSCRLKKSQHFQDKKSHAYISEKVGRYRTLWKYFPMVTPPPHWKIRQIDPPSPLENPIPSVGGGGMDIFWNHTFNHQLVDKKN